MKTNILLVRVLVAMMILQTVAFLIGTIAWAELPPPIICQKIFDDPEVDDVAVDSNGSTIVIADDVIAKYDSECNEMWPEPIEYPSYAHFYGVAVDSNGNIILAGRDDSNDVLIVKYTADGVLLWDESYDFDSYKDTAYAVAVDSNDNIIAVGGSDQTEPPWNERWIVLKCNSNGTELCRDIYTYNSSDPYENAEARDVAIDSNDNVVVTGKSKVYGGMYPDYQMLTIKYDSDCDGASLDSIWVKEYGTKDPGYGEYNRGNTVTIDSEDNIIVGGYAESALDKEVIKYTPVGALGWSWDGPDIVASAVTSIDEIIVASENKIYKLTSDLNEVWSLPYIAGYEIAGIVVDSTDNIIVGGHSSTEGCIVKYGSPPGCYTNYDFDATGPFYNYDMIVRWDEAPSTGCIYPAFQFWFQVGQGGYMGTQLVVDDKKAIFSIWDTFSIWNPIEEVYEGNETAQPAHTNCKRFNWEETGTMCIMNYGWQIGREYRLSISPDGTDDTGEYWKGTIYDTVTKKETVIGRIHLKNQEQYTGYGWLTNRSSTFLEYFCGEQTCFGHPYSKVTWRGPYANERALLADNATISYKPCPTNNITTKGRPLTIHEAGDGVERTTPPGQLWHNQPTVPDIIVSPVELNFGSVNVGSGSSPELITVTNDGIVDLEIGQSTLTGANEGDFSIQNDNCSNQIISSDSSCSLEVVFSPISVGSKTATLIVPSNDRDENPVTVSLVGTGMLPGDANGDGSINVQDVIGIINVILDTGTASGSPDCNEDGSVNVLDVICVINKILGG